MAKVVSMLQSPYLKPTLEIHMAIATETLLQKLIVDLNSDYLACFGLRLRIGNITISDRFVVLESINTRVWDPSKLPPRNFSSVGVVPTVEVERMEWAMMQLVGGNTVPANLSLPPANPAPYNQSPVQSNFYHATPPVAYPGTSIVSMTPAPAAGSNYAMPQVAYSNPSTVSAPAGSYYGPPPATYAAQWSNSVAPVHQNEMVSVTVPANYPHCGSELMTASPSSGKLFKFTIPPGSLPGSQLLISIPRI